jgi:O-antigen/teichoic acid export membrane protein
MNQVKRNVLANFVGKGWAALMSFALVPVYIKFMGIEAFGLVGVYITLQWIFSLLDMGLTPTLTRELARLSTRHGDAHAAQEARNLVRTLEVIEWLAAGGIALIMVLLVPIFSGHWIHAQRLSSLAIQQSLVLMGLVLALQFPFTIYQGGLLGLQRQVLLNGVVVFVATLRAVGAVLVLWLVSPTIQAYFAWQVVASAVQAGLGVLFLWRCLPPALARARFQRRQLLNVWRFAASMMAITLLAIVNAQIDKVILSNRVSLKAFGYYSLAAVVASQLSVLVTLLYAALFPEFSRLAALKDVPALRDLYHRGTQLHTVIIFPVAVIVALFAPELMLVWTHDAVIAQQTSLLVALLVTGAALASLMSVPDMLQWSHNWTRLGLVQSIIGVLVYAPLVYWAIGQFGAAGAAGAGIVLNAGYVLISVQVMHTRLLKHEKWRWYLQDIGLPLIGALAVASVGRVVLPRHAATPTLIVWLAVIAGATLVGAALCAPLGRAAISRQVLSRLRISRHPLPLTAGFDGPAPDNALAQRAALTQAGGDNAQLAAHHTQPLLPTERAATTHGVPRATGPSAAEIAAEYGQDASWEQRATTRWEGDDRPR